MKMRRIKLMVQVVFVAITTGAALAEVEQPPVLSERAIFAPDRIIVRLESAPKGRAVQPRPALPGVKQLRRLLPTSRFRSSDPTKDGAHQIYIAEQDSGADVLVLTRQSSAIPEVRYAEPDYSVPIDDSFPNDPDFSHLWGLHNTGQTGGVADADIDAPEGWDITTESESVIVAVSRRESASKRCPSNG